MIFLSGGRRMGTKYAFCDFTKNFTAHLNQIFSTGREQKMQVANGDFLDKNHAPQ